MPNQIEPNANNALGNLLQGMFSSAWKVRSENTQTFPEHPGRHADVLVTAAGRSPVVVEAEYEPGAEVEKDAAERLGLRVAGEPRSIEAAVALKYPQAVEKAYKLSQAVEEARLLYCVLHEDGSRFPESGWLEGSVTDLADLIRLVSVPQKEVDAAAAALEQGIRQAANVLEDMAKLRPAVTPAIARLLGMIDVPQTRRMACAILANAMIFHQRIYGIHGEVKQLHLVCGPGVGAPQGETLAAWKDILDINYWPIFAIAKDILEQLPADTAAQLLHGLLQTAQHVNATGVDNAHDLTGRIFQRLIADRKYLATFYTLPASAALLARLAVAKMEGVDWSDAEAIGKLRVGDFACGTGALLSAVYEEIAARHERAGGDPAALHPVMMEEVLYGCDVMPSAIHITGSTLSGVEPSVGFGRSRLYTMPYGRQADGSVAIGSLELLQASNVMTLFNISDPALRTGSAGEETAAHVNVDIVDEGFDLVIMNPPFTRPGSDWEGENREGDYIKHFRGLSTDLDTQLAMSTHMKEFANRTCAHGYAGIASAFTALADKKLKPGGVLALVLPLSAALGQSWEKFRQLVVHDYETPHVISLVAAGDDSLSFSADTDMAECLVVARKGRRSPALATDVGDSDGQEVSVTAQAKRICFASLKRRPTSLAYASVVAKSMHEAHSIRFIGDGPYGGTPLRTGSEAVGETILMIAAPSGESWSAVRILDYAVAQTAYGLSRSQVWLPGSSTGHNVPLVPLSVIGKRGYYHRNIAGDKNSGPFAREAASETATYPSLWNHNARMETHLVCTPDSQLRVRSGMEEKATEVWHTASRTHINQDFRFNSQPLAVAFTERASLGGRAWPNVRFESQQFEKAFTLWGNSTLGLLCFWWQSNRQVAGRGAITISSVDILPMPDIRTFSDAQLATSDSIFEEFRDRELQPAYLADADPNRALLDRRVVCDLLGFGEETYRGLRRLAAKWCAEPSVHGGKARPNWAKYVE